METNYQIIKDRIVEEAEELMTRLCERSLTFRNLAGMAGKDTVLEELVNSQLLILESAKGTIEGKSLDYDALVENLSQEDTDMPHGTLIKDATKKWIKSLVEFYKPLLQVEEEVKDYAELARMAFKTKENYEKAKDAIIEAQKKEKEAEKKYMGLLDKILTHGMLKTEIKILEERKKETAKEIFS